MTTSPNPSPTGQLIPRSAQPEGRWGGGTTNAIYAYPPTMIGAMAQAQLWVGTAAILQSAPYSHFPNRQRLHLPIRGNGLHLHFQSPAETVTLHTFDQARFAGDRLLLAELIDGPVEAFNLMFDETVLADVSVICSTVETLVVTLPTPPIHHADLPHWRVIYVLYAVNGEARVALADQPAVRLALGDAYLIEVGAEAAAHGLTLDVEWVTVPADLAVATATLLL